MAWIWLGFAGAMKIVWPIGLMIAGRKGVSPE